MYRCTNSTVKSEDNLWRVSSFHHVGLRDQTQALLAASDFICWATSLVLKLQFILVWVYESTPNILCTQNLRFICLPIRSMVPFFQLFLPVSTIHNSPMHGNHISHAALDRYLRGSGPLTCNVLPQPRYNQRLFSLAGDYLWNVYLQPSHTTQLKRLGLKGI